MGALEATNLHDWAYDQVDMYPHYPTLTKYAREAKVILEFGVRGAVSTWAFLEGLSEDGRIYSVEINPTHHMPPAVTGDTRLTMIYGDDMDADVQARMPAHADLVFIDTTHEYDHTVAELKLALSRNPRRIIMHDYVMDGVLRAGTEFCAREAWRVVDNEMPYGLATLEPL